MEIVVDVAVDEDRSSLNRLLPAFPLSVKKVFYENIAIYSFLVPEFLDWPDVSRHLV